MAKIVPGGWRELRATGAAQRELETLALLADALPDAYTVYHGVHWTRVDYGLSEFGEVDFAIVAPSGKLLLVEQKSGVLEETPDGLAKIYAGKPKIVATQMLRAVEALRARYAKAHKGAPLFVDYLLYCPDYAVGQPQVAGIDPERIVDAGRREHLARIIQSILPAHAPESPEAARICRFLGDVLELVPEIGALSDEARSLYTRISGGLATWARRIEVEPFRLRVIGTAGSGKTQLALAVLRDAVAAGRRPLYVCFNRPLADHLAQIAPREAEVLTYHQLCDRTVRANGVVPDFTHAGIFREIEAGFAAAPVHDGMRYTDLLVDEGQDFDSSWLDSLLRLLRPPGRAWWLEDPMQNLYGRAPATLPGWTVLRSDTNYRSPRDVLSDLNRLVKLDRPVEAGSPLSGSGVEIFTYGGEDGLLEETKRAISRCLGLGFKRPMVAVLTFRGREHSALASCAKLGHYTLRAFTGRYDLIGSPIYTEGEIAVETVYRFKGQSAPVVVFTEIDFEALDELAARKLFVGATRATMKLVLVMSERVAKELIERLA